MLAEAAGFGVAIGLAVGALGGGGSVLAVPVLVYALSENVHQATTSSLVIVTAAALAGGLGHARRGRVCWRHAGLFIAAAIPGIVGGTRAGAAVGGSVLIVAFSLVMFVAAFATWRRAAGADPAPRAGGEASCPPLRVARDLAAGAAIGFLTGFLGVGGGFLVVPTLAIALGFTMRLAVGTSLAIITATSVLGLVAHLLDGRSIDAGVTAAMAAGCVAGALAGSAVAGRVSHQRLGYAFAALVAGVAVYLLASVAVLGGPPGA